MNVLLSPSFLLFVIYWYGLFPLLIRDDIFFLFLYYSLILKCSYLVFAEHFEHYIFQSGLCLINIANHLFGLAVALLEDHFIFLPGEQRPMWGARDYLPTQSQAPKAPCCIFLRSAEGHMPLNIKAEFVPRMAYMSFSPESGFYSSLGSGVERTWKRGTT